MRNIIKSIWMATIILLCISLFTARAAVAEEWQVIKTSGDVWIAREGAQNISLEKGAALKDGQELRTGNNGLVLLQRGKETILVSSNSVLALPKEKPEPGKTRILQQAGEILLEVEKKNVKHFEVNTPYLSAIVKGTRFRVTVDDASAKVNVERGRVEVMDLKTGKFVLVKPGQFASVNPQNAKGLELGGKGKKEKIRSGSPRSPLVKPLKAKAGGKLNQAARSIKPKAGKPARKIASRSKGRLKLGRPIGQVRLNINKSTRGLSRSKEGKVAAGGKTYWSNSKTASLGRNNGIGNGNGNGNGKNNSNKGNGNSNGHGNGLALGKSGGVPPGLGGLPPGLAKKLGL